MNREEEIYQAIPMKLSKDEQVLWDRGEDTMHNYRGYYSDGFMAGAKWADAHPNWHKYPDEKPKEHKPYIVAFNNGNISICRYGNDFDKNNKWYDVPESWIENIEVVAWMEKPESPKFD